MELVRMYRSTRVSSLSALKLESSSCRLLKSQSLDLSILFSILKVSSNFCYLLRCDDVWSFEPLVCPGTRDPSFLRIFELSILRSYESSNSKLSSVRLLDPASQATRRSVDSNTTGNQAKQLVKFVDIFELDL